MRKLATIREVSGKATIEGMDNIELVYIDGWQVIVRKNENYQVGDRTIYVEIDSLLPEVEWSEFLRAKKFKIKTMKLRGTLSQGICFPLSILPEDSYNVGDDVTEILGITQYDKQDEPEIITKKQRHPFFNWFFRFRLVRKFFGKNSKERRGWPEWISKTDETRIENVKQFLDDKDTKYTVTTKMDGSSYSVGIQRYKTWYGKTKYEFYLCSRNVRKGLLPFGTNDKWCQPVYKYKFREMLEKILNLSNGFDAVYVQGELLGPGIQKNHYALNDYKVEVFNIVFVNTKTGQKYLCNYDEQQEICYNFGFDQVELRAWDYVLPDTIPELQKWVHRKSAVNPKVLDEGCVFRNYDKQRSFKCVDPDFLMKYENFEEGVY